MIEKPVTDKVRFWDDQTKFNEKEGPFVHTVEISDERSSHNFITWYNAGKNPRVNAATTRLKQRLSTSQHDPSIFHRDDKDQKWVDDCFGDGKWKSGWVNHHHVRYPIKPRYGEIENFIGALEEENAISEYLKTEILDYYRGQ